MNSHAVTIHRQLAIVLLALAALIGYVDSSGPSAARPAPAPAFGSHATARTGLDLDLYQSRLLHLINKRRHSHHLHPVSRDGCVDRLSKAWAAHLADTGGFVHRDQHVVLRRCHMHWAGEALARGTGLTPSAAVSAWMHSPEHRAILMKSRAQLSGIGARLDDQARLVLVLNFADPRG